MNTVSESDCLPTTFRSQAAEKQSRALELRNQGLGFAEIATVVGYSGRQAARKAAIKALKRLQPPEESPQQQQVPDPSLPSRIASYSSRVIKAKEEFVEAVRESVRTSGVDPEVARARLCGLVADIWNNAESLLFNQLYSNAR